MLLFDEHLSPKLCLRLAKEFPGSVHVHDAGLGNTPDITVWDFALSEGLIIVTKDSDFPDFQSKMGFPPKIVWIRIGNSTTKEIEQLLRVNCDKVFELAEGDDHGLLIIR